jgi:hypothetical protein
MKFPRFTAVLDGTPDVIVNPMPGGMAAAHIEDQHPTIGISAGTVTLYGTPAQLLAVAEGIRDGVHLVEAERLAAELAAEVAHTAEVGG